VQPKHHWGLLRPLLERENHPALRETGDGLQHIYLTSVSENLAQVLLGLAGLNPREFTEPQLHDSPRLLIERELPGQQEWEDIVQRKLSGTDIPDTIRQALVRARVGQGLFKERVAQVAILDAIGKGEAEAPAAFLDLVYTELRHLAASKMAREAPGQTLQATALVHEAWLRLVGDDNRRFEDRTHFFAAAAEAMRRILIERARSRKAVRHGGEYERVNLDEDMLASAAEDEQLLALNDAVEKLELPQFAGLYAGAVSEEKTRHVVEDADLVLDLGGVSLNDETTAGYSGRLDSARFVSIGLNDVRIGEKVFGNVLLAELESAAPGYRRTPGPAARLNGSSSDKITMDALYSRYAAFIRPGDSVVLESGSSSLGLPPMTLPDDVQVQIQMLWGSIGWATGAAFGARKPADRVAIHDERSC
jgi:RNA polymerase sigma factor (TIGR02999 family)